MTATAPHRQAANGRPPAAAVIDVEALKAERKKLDAAPFDGKLTPYNVAELRRTDPPPVEWLAEGIMARGVLTLMAGDSGSGKTMFSLGLCGKIARGGGDYAGFDCAAGRPVFLDAENGRVVIHRRVHALDLPDFPILNVGPDFDALHDLELLREVVKHYRADALVIDSFRSTWSGCETDDAEVKKVLAPLGRLAHEEHIAILFLHHFSRGKEWRGHSVIKDIAHLLLTFEQEENDDEIPGRRVIREKKNRVDRLRADRWIEMCASATQVRFRVADPFAGPPRRRKS